MPRHLGVPKSKRAHVLLTGSFVVLALAGAALWFFDRSGVPLDFRRPLVVEQVLSGVDENRNGVDDLFDIVEGAREQVELNPVYRSAYYRGGYPPDGEGVCTDVVWRAFRYARYEWKDLIDRDIAAATGSYARVGGRPDPNIDFRRVPNLHVFLSRAASELTTAVPAWDPDSLKEWQPGDLVIFGPADCHIGIVSDRRRLDGIPLVIHHGSATPVEDNILVYWGDRIEARFRVSCDNGGAHRPFQRRAHG